MTKVLSMMLIDAAEAKLITTTPFAPADAANAHARNDKNASGPPPPKSFRSPTKPPHSSAPGPLH
ncbi:hypothetical protein [Saccharopolyspora sp. NPDC050642]|uniref:hypothetical protein n=1 Tax=Saccharopolyspora sp. NPDC050642 TaxID=3157099 RepID=UPI0033D2A716